jgi:hypothetical protein
MQACLDLRVLLLNQLAPWLQSKLKVTLQQQQQQKTKESFIHSFIHLFYLHSGDPNTGVTTP